MRRLMFVTTCLVAMLMPVSASAQSTEEIVSQDFSYEDGGLAVFTGPAFEDGCRGEGFSEFPARVRTRGDLVLTFARFTPDVRVYDLAEAGVGSLGELLGVACAAVEAGEAPPQPFATGDGQAVLRERCLVGADGCFSPGSVLHLRTRLGATLVSAADGRRCTVRASAAITATFGDDVVTEEEIDQQLRVRCR